MLKKRIQILYNDSEPFKEIKNKKTVVVGHSIDALYYNNGDWYLETRAYLNQKIRGSTLIIYRNIFRFIFTGELPIEIQKLLPKGTIERAKTQIVCFQGDIEFPVMSGEIIKLKAYNGAPLYYIKNPTIKR